MNKLVPALLLATALPFAAIAQSQGQSPVAGFMAHFDQNKDGKVSQEEYQKVQTADIDRGLDMAKKQAEQMKKQLGPMFQQMDKNHDGSIEKAEVEAIVNAMHQRMQQEHGAPAGKGE